MRCLFAIFCFVTIHVSVGQIDTVMIEKKLKTNIKNKSITERYQITLPDSVKNGTFERLSIYNKHRVKGQFINDEKVGIWNYYSNNVYADLIEQLDWTNKKTVFIDTLKNRRIYPYFFGGSEARRQYLNNKIASTFTKQELENHKGQSLRIQFEFDTDGNPINVHVFEFKNEVNNKIIENKLINIIKNMPKWQVDGKPFTTIPFMWPITF
jgi:hypothetical protein